METYKMGKSGVLISRKAPACGATDTESYESPILVRKREVSTNYSDDSDDDVPSRRRRRTTAVEVVGGRTFPGELARKIIAGYMNPRVVPGNASRDPVRHDYWCSRPQAAALLAKCIPRHLSNAFVDSLTRHQAKFDNVLDVGQWGVLPNGIPPRAKICRTYVANIHLAFIDVFGKDNVSLEMCEHPNGDHSKRSVQCPYILEIAVLDAVLNRTKKTPRVLKSKKATVDTPVKMKITDVGLKDLKHDTRFRALVAVLPEAGVFYCHRERRKEYVGVANTHVPMDINWLRIVKNGSRDSCFASGGYVKRLWDGDAECVWKWKISCRSTAFAIPDKLTLPLVRWPNSDQHCLKTVHQVAQCADEDSPRLPPDFIDNVDRSGDGVEVLRREYLDKYVNSSTAKRNCRHYVARYLYKNIDPNSVWVIDPKVDGATDVNVSVHIRHPNGGDKVALVRDSLVQIRYLPHAVPDCERLLGMIRDHASSIGSSLKKGAVVRSSCGDWGKMHAIGSRVHLNKRRRIQFVTSSGPTEQRKLRRAVRAAAQLLGVTIPAVLRVMQDVEDDSDILPQHGMAGDGEYGRVSHSMDVSDKLVNASHYDANDGSQGASIFTEDRPGSTKDWYFVLPNVFGRKNGEGKTYNGMAIRLTHGVLVSWDGRLIRHCTAKMDCARECHVYGTFFAAKSKIVTFGMDRKIRRHLRRELLEEQNGKASLSAATVDDVVPDDGDVVPDDGYVPIFQHSDDSSGGESGDDSDCSVDEGIAGDIVGKRIIDTGLWEESLPQANVAVASHFAKQNETIAMDVTSEIVELRIPRKVSKSAQPSLIVAEEPCTIPRTVTTLKPAPAPNFAIPVVDRQQPRYDGRRQEQNVRRPWSFFHQEEASRHHQQEERRHQEGRCHELERRHHDGRQREERCRQEKDRRRSQGDEERQCHHDGRRREEDGRRRQEEERCYLEWRRLREATRCQEEEKCRQERRLHA